MPPAICKPKKAAVIPCEKPKQCEDKSEESSSSFETLIVENDLSIVLDDGPFNGVIVRLLPLEDFAKSHGKTGIDFCVLFHQRRRGNGT